MDRLQLITSLQALVGAGFLFFSIRLSREAGRGVPQALRNRWHTLTLLMHFFLAGYLVFAITLFLNRALPIELLTGSVFLGGAFLVLIVINLSKYTIEALRQEEQCVQSIHEKIQRKNEILKREIKARIAFEKDLTKSSDDWRLTFDNTTDLILLLTPDLAIVKANRAAIRFLETSFETLIGRDFSAVLEESGLDLPLSEYPVHKLKASKRHEEAEAHFSKKGLWVLASADPVLAADGRLSGVVHVLRDITERKKMEGLLIQAKATWEETFNTINDAITIHDRDFNVVLCNRAAHELLGATPDRIRSRKCYQSYHGTQSPPQNCPSCESLIRGCPSTVETYEPHLGKHLEVKALPRFDAKNRVVGLVHVVRDITERKNAEEEQLNLQAQLMQIQKIDSIGCLAGGIAHDFNNILTGIIGYSEITLMALGTDDPLRENLCTLRELGEKAASLTQQLLAFSRKQVLETQVINLNVHIENMAKMLGRLIGEDVSLVWDGAAPVPNVLADPCQIEQVVMNLSVNARDAMPDGGRLTIKTEAIQLGGAFVRRHREVKPGPYVRMCVSDTGQGMTPDVQARIFDPFFTTKERGKGTGLGLSTVYGIVKQHNGYIYFESEPGRGTTFNIYLPVAEQEPESRASWASGIAEGGSETVLVVEDDTIIRELLLAVLTPLGYLALVAESGEEAVELSAAHDGTIDLLLTDVIMPGINGRELADQLQSSRPGIKVIFMSGYTDDAIVHHGVLEPGIAFLQKPVSPTRLREKLREVLDADAQPLESQP